ncbi:relaxin-3-like [Eublepharis macularius]|uniref:Relaxin-3-like n=1 Tax=Eublepharis macularius TaxID=481883 RepID=A0AA97L5Z7_EUBMA|nr:relaxin-3-like [Eublepharis macularius]
MRLKKPLLLLLLLAAAGLNGRDAPAAGAEALSESHPNGEYGIKLCGREFIRAVIFICGGSRWKRLSESSGAEERSRGGGAGTEFVQGIEDIKLQSVLDPELEQLQHIGQQPLKVMFNLYGDYNVYVPASDNFSEYIRQIESGIQQRRGLAKLIKLNNFPWVNSPRRKRDYSMGVAEMCCKWGCTKTEVSRLC